MELQLAIIVIISIFEIFSLIKNKKKKESIIFIIISTLTICLGSYMILVKDYECFAEIIFKLLKI